MFKRAQNTPVFLGDNWSYYYIAAWCYLPGLHLGISSNYNKAIRTYRCGGCAGANAKWDWIEETVFSVSFLLGGFAGLLACATTRTRTCLDYRLLSWLPDPMIDWFLSRVHVYAHVPHDHHARSIGWRLSTNTRTRARAPWKRKMKMNPAGQARSGQVMSYSAPCCTRHLLVCLLFVLFFLLPVYRVCTLALAYGRYDANYVLCTPYSSAYACMCVYRYLNWTGN